MSRQSAAPRHWPYRQDRRLCRARVDVLGGVRRLAGKITCLFFCFAERLIEIGAGGTGLSHDTPLLGLLLHSGQ